VSSQDIVFGKQHCSSRRFTVKQVDRKLEGWEAGTPDKQKTIKFNAQALKTFNLSAHEL
jgi:hypothetical protein